MLLQPCLFLLARRALQKKSSDLTLWIFIKPETSVTLFFHQASEHTGITMANDDKSFFTNPAEKYVKFKTEFLIVLLFGFTTFRLFIYLFILNIQPKTTVQLLFLGDLPVWIKLSNSQYVSVNLWVTAWNAAHTQTTVHMSVDSVSWSDSIRKVDELCQNGTHDEFGDLLMGLWRGREQRL